MDLARGRGVCVEVGLGENVNLSVSLASLELATTRDALARDLSLLIPWLQKGQRPREGVLVEN